MEISPKLLQTAVDQLVLLLGLLLVMLLVQLVPAVRIRIPRPHIPRGLRAAVLLRVVPALGIVATGAVPCGAAVLQRRPRPMWAQTSSQVETDGPPPLPSVRPRRVRRDGVRHPAIHPGTPLTRPLFPRARVESKPNQEKGRAMELHPAGKNVQRDSYEVQSGDTLWDIAARLLRTKDPARIARFWPQLHHVNLDELGKDPNRLFPGQVLRIPKERP